MSDYEPEAPYVYQPGAPDPRVPAERDLIYAVAGPGTETFDGLRMTRVQACALQQMLIEKSRVFYTCVVDREVAIKALNELPLDDADADDLDKGVRRVEVTMRRFQ